LETAAKELGKLIAQTPEYRYYSQAAKDVEEDKETSELLQKLKEYEKKVLEAQKAGGKPSEELKKEYTRFMEELQSRSDIQALIASQENYLKLMDRVNKQIAEGIRMGSQSRIITNF